MKFRLARCAAVLLLGCCAFFLCSADACAGDAIPTIAWKRGIGVPLPNHGTRKAALTNLIDDGYWQGAPVGGFGAGTFSRTYRGELEGHRVEIDALGCEQHQTVIDQVGALGEITRR